MLHDQEVYNVKEFLHGKEVLQSEEVLRGQEVLHGEEGVVETALFHYHCHALPQ